MRKTQKNIIVLAVLALALVAFCACGVIASATAIKISSYPKTSYTTSDADFDWTGFKLAITTSDGNNTEYTYDQLENQANFTVSKFDDSVGTHTATITYQTLEATFQYTVAAGTFAGGEGTQANPYQISTVEQWENMINHAYDNLTYFVLINDIDMTDYNGNNTYAANISIDGGDYWVKNLSSYLVYEFGNDEGSGNLFEVVSREGEGAGRVEIVKPLGFMPVAGKNFYSEIKNLNIQINYNKEMPIFDSLTGENCTLSNINIYGKSKNETASSNETILAAYPNATNLTLNSVKIYADFITQSNYAGVFFGNSAYHYATENKEYRRVRNSSDNGWLFDDMGKTSSSITMNDCGFYGYAEGDRIGLIMGNTNNSASRGELNFTLNNVVNGGTINGTSYAAVFCTHNGAEFNSSVNVIVDGKKVNNNTDVNITGINLIKLDSLKFVYGNDKVLKVECSEEKAVKFVVAVMNWNDAYTKANKEDGSLYGTSFVQLYSTTVERGTDGIGQPMINNEALKFLGWKYDDTVSVGGVKLDSNVYKINSYIAPYYMGKTTIEMKAAGAGQARNKANYRVMAYDASGKLLGVAYAEASK